MENYDFLVWFKVFYEANFQEWPPGYDAKEVRGNFSFITYSNNSEISDIHLYST